MTPPVYLPWAPLETHIRTTTRKHVTSDRQHAALTLDDIATELGVARSTIYHYRRTGHLRWHRADHYACHLGVHPYTVWGDDWWHLEGAA